jgi:hypothetical protein
MVLLIVLRPPCRLHQPSANRVDTALGAARLQHYLRITQKENRS